MTLVNEVDHEGCWSLELVFRTKVARICWERGGGSIMT